MGADTQPVLIGGGQIVRRDDDPQTVPSPQDLMALAARDALADSGATVPQLAAKIDTIAAIRTFADSAPQYASPFDGARNYPAAVARRIGASPARCLYPVLGGNTPQEMVNRLAEDIRRGRSQVALIVGGEVQRGMAQAKKAGLDLDWSEPAESDPVVVGDLKMGVLPHELKHGLAAPADIYPMFETALAAHYGRDMAAHREQIAALCARLSAVAADNPHAALPVARRADEILTPTAANRLVAWPYTKFMNANIAVDQAAAVLLCSLRTARDLGVEPERIVYLAGSADVNEKWFLSDRTSFHASPAIAAAGKAALGRAGLGLDDMSAFDLYSCFPVAVEIAADALGLAHDDPRVLTVTGGLPFFGGPGNNYSLHAIAEMVARLRGKPGDAGMVTANGWYLTKHSVGIYSAAPPRAPWRRESDAALQDEIDAAASPSFTDMPEGRGRIEAATLQFNRDGAPGRGFLFGRLETDDSRFLAVTAEDDADIQAALTGERPVGLSIRVARQSGLNIARLA